ncbi:MAG TPA: response regulator [Candidatus Brocadiia bacterium]|nr:response regulator [Planctomycetota bacterium]MDO8094454.1 response regulator [Candidatus Brocadiales bacterium]
MGNILLIEHNADQRMLYETALREEGYKVVSVGSAKEALLNVEFLSPDIIVLDILMPDMDGIQLIGRLLSFNKRHKIVVHTAYKTFENNLMMLGVDAYILKCSDLTILKDRIHKLLEQSNEFNFQWCSNN